MANKLADAHPALFMTFSSFCRDTRFAAVREGGCRCKPGECAFKNSEFLAEALENKAKALQAQGPVPPVEIVYFKKPVR